MQTIPQLLDTLNRLADPAPGRTPETAVADLIALYKEVASYIQAHEEIKNKIKAAISEIMEETAVLDYSSSAGRAYIPRPSIVTSYDTKAIDALCQSDPDLGQRLRPFRRQTERAGSLTIR